MVALEFPAFALRATARQAFSDASFLRIEHLAVIDAVQVEFEPGLNVLTGETGAGKSMLVEAVGLLMGGRASADLIRTGETCQVRPIRCEVDPRPRGVRPKTRPS